MIKSRLKKTFIIIASTLFIAALIAILCISPITKYLVEKYDVKYTGREIKMDWVYVNPFTGYAHFSNLKIYESKSDSVFLSADGLSINFSVRKILSSTYEISQLTLDHPKGTIIQINKNFSFDDLIEKFRPKKTDTPKEPVHFNILGIKINNGEFYYRENVLPINYFIKQVNIESTGKRWDTDTVATAFSFISGRGTGTVKGNSTINLNTLDYHFAAVVNKFDLQILEQSLKNLAAYGSFSANMDADIKAVGNFNDEENINTHGSFIINDFHFGKNPKEDYASFNKLIVSMEEVSPKEHKYLFDSVSVKNPYFMYEKYDQLDNIENMFGKNGANVKAVNEDPNTFNLVLEIARYMKVLAKNFFKSSYKINRLAIYSGNLKFNDYSISEKFSAAVSPLYITADSINKKNKRVEAILRTGIKPYGSGLIKVSINPNDSSDFDITYQLRKLSAASFNPYIISYTSFPLDRGTIELNGAWKVRSGIIQSNNHLLIIDPRMSKRLRNKDRKWIPMPLVMFLVRERGNVIDYEIPITGNLNKPKFHFKDVIFDILENIFIKPPTTPYAMEVRTTEEVVEKSLSIKWAFRKTSLQANEEIFVNKIAAFLKENPQASISIHSNQYEVKEKEYILFYEAKKKYYLMKNNKTNSSYSEEDSITVNKMSAKDPMFVKYLNNHLKDTLLFTIQQKCSSFLGSSIVNIKYDQVLKQREHNFRDFFKKNGTENRVKFYAAKNKIPYNGFSFYEIKYPGELPESLSKAYEEMNELNNEAPRKKYLKERKNIFIKE